MDRRGEHGLAEPRLSRRDGGSVVKTANLRVRVAVEPGSAGASAQICRNGGKPAGLVEDRLRSDRQYSGVDDDVGGHHQNSVGPLGVRHELRVTGKSPVVDGEAIEDDRWPDGPLRHTRE
jgi:hypothetical protein